MFFSSSSILTIHVRYCHRVGNFHCHKALFPGANPEVLLVGRQQSFIFMGMTIIGMLVAMSEIFRLSI